MWGSGLLGNWGTAACSGGALGFDAESGERGGTVVYFFLTFFSLAFALSFPLVV